MIPKTIAARYQSNPLKQLAGSVNTGSVSKIPSVSLTTSLLPI